MKFKRRRHFEESFRRILKERLAKLTLKLTVGSCIIRDEVGIVIARIDISVILRPRSPSTVEKPQFARNEAISLLHQGAQSGKIA